MNRSTRYQNDLEVELLRFFPGNVRNEYYIPKKAADDFSLHHSVYIPRADLAVGPFNEEGGNRVSRIREGYGSAPAVLSSLTRGLSQNQNPRCLFAIEVVYSGTSKHILGDILNAGTLGLYGIVLPSNEMHEKVLRIVEYLKLVKKLHKLADDFSANVAVVKADDFLRSIRGCGQ